MRFARGLIHPHTDSAGKWFARLCFLAVTVVASQSVGAEDAVTFETDSRRWRDASGKHEIHAALVRYHDRQVTLRRADGKTIDVPLDRLSTTDRVYLARQRRLARKRPSLDGDLLVSSDRPMEIKTIDTNRTADQGRAGEREQLFGVDWHPMDSAHSLAQRESKPVMWFRVLGDLDGFM